MSTIAITELVGFADFVVSRENVGVEEFKTVLRRWGVSLREEEYLDLLDKVSKEEGLQQAILSILTYDNPYQTAQTNVFITMSEIDGLWRLWAIEKDGRFRSLGHSSNLRRMEENGFFVILESIK